MKFIKRHTDDKIHVINEKQSNRTFNLLVSIIDW